MSLLAKAHTLWLGTSENVVEWTSDSGIEVKYLPDTGHIIEWLRLEPVNHILSLIEKLRNYEFNFSQLFDKDIFGIGLMRYTHLAAIYIVGLCILTFIFSILAKISMSKKIYKCYTVMSRHEIDFQIEEICKFLINFNKYIERSKDMSRKVSR